MSVLTDEEQEQLREAHMVQVIVWGAILMSVFVYLAVAYLTKKEAIVEIDPMVRWVVIAVALLDAIASLAVFPAMMSPSKLRKRLQQENRIQNIKGLYFTTLILRLALAESVAIFGLVLSMMSGDFNELLPFASASIVLLVLAYPSPDSLKNRLIRL